VNIDRFTDRGLVGEMQQAGLPGTQFLSKLSEEIETNRHREKCAEDDEPPGGGADDPLREAEDPGKHSERAA
jgi:hypothetical protein